MSTFILLIQIGLTAPFTAAEYKTAEECYAALNSAEVHGRGRFGVQVGKLHMAKGKFNRFCIKVNTPQ